MTAAVQFEFDAATHTYRDADKVIRPSVSQVIKAEGLISFDGINPAILEVKRQLGTLVHTVTELYDTGENLNDYEIPDEVWPYFDGWVNFREDCGFEPRFIEHRRIAQVRNMWYGMCLDRRGQVDGVDHIIELKCSSCVSPAWGVQLAAYCMGVEVKDYPARAAVQLGAQFPRGYKMHPYTDKSDFTEWMCCLASAMWKINHGIFAFDHLPERIELGSVA